MKALDLFCGAGGSSMGIKQAGFDKVVGVDIYPQPEFPFEFIQSDVFKLELDLIREFDLIWASPPCQKYSFSTARAKKEYGKTYPDLVGKTRSLLKRVRKPFVIENVVGSPLRIDLWLCGCMFDLGVFRRRHFEIRGFVVRQPKHRQHTGAIGDGKYFRVLDGGGCWLKKGEIKGTMRDWQKAMGIDWINDKAMLAEAIPPAYSKYIAINFLKPPFAFLKEVFG